MKQYSLTIPIRTKVHVDGEGILSIGDCNLQNGAIRPWTCQLNHHDINKRVVDEISKLESWTEEQNCQIGKKTFEGIDAARMNHSLNQSDFHQQFTLTKVAVQVPTDVDDRLKVSRNTQATFAEIQQSESGTHTEPETDKLNLIWTFE